MTVDLSARDATDSERLVLAWLGPLGYRAAVARRAGDSLPFVIVTELIATEDSQQLAAYPTVSVHILAATAGEVKTVADLVHRRMLVLADDPLQDIHLDAETASIEWLETVERPHAEYYSDTVARRVARYRMAVPFIDIPAGS